MQFKQYSDDCLIVASGSFLLKSKDSNAKLHIDLRPEYNFEMDLIWTFKKENPDEVAKVFLGNHNNNLLELIIVNADSLFGHGTMQPTTLAEFSDKKKLCCNYFFNRPEDKNPRLLTYSLYIEG